ncbi:glycosyltransferase family 4 protein [Flavobacterium sp. SUN046]|uniref:glycosyltransferase family 4 protein n=1 Tax=Flavobacterium sp. SUN046 TaxID=3002440 RepID=UPI002DB7A0CC|nr:glycosyltransferase family 4 protein [Flavobacterium sp. SUN046]MEC4049927.1 glycosyltransferase family 4 protein [Flavobacterium sp. SUN046]
MKILLLHQFFLEENDSGGSRWNEITKVWSEKEHDITVVAGMMHYGGKEKPEQYKGKFFVKKKQGEVDVWRCHVSENYNTNFLGRLYGYFSFVFSSLFVGLFKLRNDYDLIVVTSPPLFIGITGYILSRFKNIPFVFEVRDLWPESAIDTGVVRNKYLIKISFWLERFIYKKAILINVLTPAFKETLITKKKVDPHKIIYVPNAADFSISDAYLRHFDVKQFKKEQDLEDRFVVTYVGAHGLANHLEQILQTANIMQDTKALFLLIGQGMEKERLMKKAQQLELTNVRFIDSVPKAEIFKYILASDVGASVLKKVDAFKTVYSNKTFDYMSCKKPTIMAIDGVSRELIEKAEAGVYVEPENPTDFKNKLLLYMNNPELIQTHGANGYRFAKANFDRSILAERYLREITELKVELLIGDALMV